MVKVLAGVVLALVLLRSGGKDDRAGIFSTIDVAEDETAGDVACMFCTVNLRGDVHGDLAVLFGTVNADADRTISGDVAVLFSTLRLGENDVVKGDMATALSTVSIPASATVRGSRAVMASGLGLGVVLAPLLVLIGVIWLVVHLVRRNRYPYPV